MNKVWGFASRNSLGLILLLAIGARLPGLAAKPLWYDEAFAVLFSDKGPTAMAYGTLTAESGVAADVHPLAFYTLLWFWGNAFGVSPLSVRLLPLFLGFGVVVVGYFLSKRMFNSQAATTTGFLLAISPMLIRYSQEVRMYALLALLLIGATYVYWEAINGGPNWTWLVFSILAASAQYTHTLAILYLLPLTLTSIFLRKRRLILKTAFAGLLAFLLYLPWLLGLPSQFARIKWAYWISKPGPEALVRTFLTFFVGLPVQSIQFNKSLYIFLLAISLFLVILVIVIALWSTIKGVRRGDVQTKRALWLFYLAVAPIILMYLISQWQPVYLDRALLPSCVAFLLWLGLSQYRSHLSIRFQRTAWMGMILLFAIGIYTYFSYRSFPYAPYADLNTYLRQHIGDSEVILHSNKITALPAEYYDPDLDHRYLADPPGTASDTLALATQQVLGLLAAQDISSAVGMAKGVWFVIFPREIENYQELGYFEHPSLSWFYSNYACTEDVVSFGELDVYHFVDFSGNRLDE